MAVKPWRPPEWEGINPKPIGTSMSSAFNREEMYKHGEKCADAMLGELRNFIQAEAYDCRSNYWGAGYNWLLDKLRDK